MSDDNCDYANAVPVYMYACGNIAIKVAGGVLDAIFPIFPICSIICQHNIIMN